MHNTMLEKLAICIPGLSTVPMYMMKVPEICTNRRKRMDVSRHKTVKRIVSTKL